MNSALFMFLTGLCLHLTNCNASHSESSDEQSDEYATELETVTFGTYNTYELFTAPGLAERKELQLSELLNTYEDIDILCLQEIYFLTEKQDYIHQLSSLYDYNAGETQQWIKEDPEKATLPRVACSNDDNGAVTAANSECIATNCGSAFESGDFETLGLCVATYCISDYITMLYTECGYCLYLVSSYLPLLGLDITLANGLYVCNYVSLDFHFEVQDDTILFSKYPIVNTYFYHLPSNVLGSEVGLNVAEISIPNMEDNIFVGCSHFQALASDISFLSFDSEISTVFELNEAQILTSIEHINNSMETLGEDNPFIWLGDMNIGKLQTPEYFSVFEESGQFIDMSDLKFKKKRNQYREVCTWCADDTADDYNKLTVLSDVGDDFETDTDIDHILIQENDNDKYSIVGISGERIFVEMFNVSSVNDETSIAGKTPLSDHYGLLLELQFDISHSSSESNSKSDSGD